MKTKKVNKKLELSKATIATLTTKSLQNLKGGYYYTELWGGDYCRTWHPECPTMAGPYLCPYD